MTVSCENDNNVIVYALEKIIDYTRKNQYIFVVQRVCWIASSFGLSEGLVMHIDNLRIRSEVYQAPSVAYSYSGHIHPEWLPLIEQAISGQEDQFSQDLEKSVSEQSSTSEDFFHDQISMNCEDFLKESQIERKKIARRNLQVSKRISKETARKIRKDNNKPQKNYNGLSQGIEASEILRRKRADECQHCAWPRHREEGHNTLECFRWAKIENGTAPFPKRKN